MDRLEEVKKYGRKARGHLSLVRYLSGERLTRQKSIEAKCYECCGYCVDGVKPCTIKGCPLWPYSPFRKTEKQDSPSPDSVSGTPRGEHLHNF